MVSGAELSVRVSLLSRITSGINTVMEFLTGLFVGATALTVAFVWWMRRVLRQEDPRTDDEESPSSSVPHQSLWH